MTSTAAQGGVRRASSRLSGRGVESVAKTVDSTGRAKKRDAGDDEVVTSSSKKIKQTESPSAASKAGLLKVGQSLPALTLNDQTGKTVNVEQLKKAVIFTYPKANTGGCTTQACLYRDEYAEWHKAGFAVYGLSNDGQTSLRNWKEKRGFQYDLLSDPKRELIVRLTGSKTSTPRSHFVIDSKGTLALSSISVKPANSSPDALKFAQSL